MKKKLTVLFVLILMISLVSCGNSKTAMKTYEFDEMAITLPEGTVEEEEGFTAYYYNDDEAFTAVKENTEKFAYAGLDINNYTLEDYAKLVYLANSLPEEYALDENGNMCTMYTMTSDDVEYFYYTLVERSEDAFWALTFICTYDTYEEHYENFINYIDTITFD